MIKMIGACLVIGSMAGLGNDRAKDIKKRLDALYQCKTLITLLRGQIRYAGADLEECFWELSNRFQEPFHQFCVSLAEAIRNLSGRPFDALWNAVVAETMEYSGLTKEDRAQFLSVGRALGFLDTESQCRHLDNYMEQLEIVIQRAEEEVGQKTKLCRSLGVCAGLFLTLVLL